jgi:uncharacterized protein YbjT (DUF2867 family)
VIAVTGAAGALGGRVAAGLAAAGVEQRLVVRDPSRAPSLDGVDVAGGAEYADGEAMRRAFDGADTVLLVSAGEDIDRVSLHRNAVDAAVAAGVERIVYTSFAAAAPDTAFTFGRDHFHTEEHIKATGGGGRSCATTSTSITCRSSRVTTGSSAAPGATVGRRWWRATTSLARRWWC